MLTHRNKPDSSKSTALPVLVIGSGIAGLSAALHLASSSRVILLAKSEIAEGNTRYAQGGIASVWSKNDSLEEHLADTLLAGAGLCREPIAKICVEEGPARVRELIEWGVEFTKAAGHQDYDLHQEGGHHKRRILHAQDFTGLAIESALISKVREHPNIEIWEHHMAIDLIMKNKILKSPEDRCLGAYVLNCKTQTIQPLAAQITLLATGGAGKVYLYTSNPDVATGDGIALAHRAGARIANLEFMQFHPTCLYHPEAKSFLITEALRGEGAVLRNLQGEEFMKQYHEMHSLAPRYVVAQAIDLELKRSGASHVWLDCSSISEDTFRTHFPQVYQTCVSHGIHPPRDWIPVVPAAHYLCGGVNVNEFGETSVQGLYAIGETACTGLHGANRLASNSLLEAVVFSKRAADHIRALTPGTNDALRAENLPVWDFGRAVDIEEQIDIAATWREIRTLMWNYVGIVRSDRRLKRARERLALIRHEVNEDYWKFRVNRDLLELRNLLTVAELMVESALRRKESRGLHVNVDYTAALDSEKRDTIL